MKNQTEVWLPVKGYEGFYEVSNIGNVKRLNTIVKYKNGSVCTHKERVLKQENLRGYKRVTLSKQNKTKRFLVHRLVAIHFLLNIDSKKCVNHKDGNKINNCLENLEWFTHSENEIHSYRVLNKINSQRKLNEENVSYVLNNFIKGRNGNIKELSLKFKVNVKTIYNVINKKYYV